MSGKWECGKWECGELVDLVIDDEIDSADCHFGLCYPCGDGVIPTGICVIPKGTAKSLRGLRRLPIGGLRWAVFWMATDWFPAQGARQYRGGVGAEETFRPRLR